ncbi:MAG: Asp-tRNA(Asn)/Glu-tRNA(Gln) amidotransferase subunit GatB [Elusimicrobiota bacterium]
MSAAWETVIGLEVHCQLATASKLFCPCPTAPAEPNTNICPVCTGQPGALPSLNRRAVELAFRAALALGCRLRERSVFARKNYFYPDLPKGYQISQYEEPYSEAGFLEVSGRRIGITRAHMEEDAGKLLHGIGSQRLAHTLVDLNRAGVPLVEIVSDPDLRSPEEAFQYLSSMRSVLRYCSVSRCDMEKGEMRCDANVSVRRLGSGLGVKVEVKNLNSLRAVRDALAYESQRQTRELEAGGSVVQETRLWDHERGVTEAMRSKEDAHDYRYFPDPDLLPLVCDPVMAESARASLPELPAARRMRLGSQYGLTEYDAGVLTAEKSLADYFEDSVRADPGSAKAAANWIGTELLGRLNAEDRDLGDCPVPPRALGELAGLLARGTISSKSAKEVFAKMWETREGPGELVDRLGLAQVSDPAQIGRWVEEAIAESPAAAADLRAGKDRAIGVIVGLVMKKSRGKAHPGTVNRLIKEKLK